MSQNRTGTPAQAGAPLTAPLLETSGLSKRYPGVLAVDDFDLAVPPGEILALLGPNGAGKSTVIKILSGVIPAGSYGGEVRLAGVTRRARSVADAEGSGIAMVPQEIATAPDLTVAETICLNAEPSRFGFVDGARRQALAAQALAGFELAIDPAMPMGALDLAAQQLVLIARALSKRARVLILDEPTAALTDAEVRRLFRHMRAFAAAGGAVIFVTHRLAEVFAVADRIAVMRDGRLRGAFATGETSREAIVREMVGLAKPVERSGAAPLLPARPPALEVGGLVVLDPDPRRPRRVDGLDFAVAPGEIVGLFGLLGAGCGEAAMAVFGAADGAVTGTVRIDGKACAIGRPADAIRLGIGLMAPDRRDTLLPEHSVVENVMLAGLGGVSRHGVLDMARMRRRAADLAARVRIKAASIDTAVGTLSGGNQQKVQIARWLAADIRILLMVDPTRGVDVGARAEIHAIWRDLAARGFALLLTASDAEELVEVCDRVIVMRAGRAVAALAGDAVTEDALLHAATGE